MASWRRPVVPPAWRGRSCSRAAARPGAGSGLRAQLRHGLGARPDPAAVVPRAGIRPAEGGAVGRRRGGARRDVPGDDPSEAGVLAALVFAGAGAGRPASRRARWCARLVAVTVYVWSPFVAERLVIGHWPVLVGYAVLPWVVDAARTWRATGRTATPVVVARAAGQPERQRGTGHRCRAGRLRCHAEPCGGAHCSCWSLPAMRRGLSPGCCTPGDAVTSATGVSMFALQDEGSVPAPLAALTLGGIWNSEVVPCSRTGVLGWVSLVFVVGVAVLGVRRWREVFGPRDVAGIRVVLGGRFGSPSSPGWCPLRGMVGRPRPGRRSRPRRFPAALALRRGIRLRASATAPRRSYDGCLGPRGRGSRSRSCSCRLP